MDQEPFVGFFGNTVVVQMPQTASKHDALNVLKDAITQASARGMKQIQLRMPNKAARDAAHELGFQSRSYDEYMRLFLVDSLEVSDCAILEFAPGVLKTKYPALWEEASEMCYLGAFFKEEYHTVYLARDVHRDVICGFAAVKKFDHGWLIEMLCAVVRGAGKALFQHVLHAAHDAGKNLVILPENDTLSTLYSSWGVATSGRGHTLTFEKPAITTTLGGHRSRRRPRRKVQRHTNTSRKKPSTRRKK